MGSLLPSVFLLFPISYFHSQWNLEIFLWDLKFENWIYATVSIFLTLKKIIDCCPGSSLLHAGFFNISPSNGCSGLISFRIDWFVLFAVQRTLKSLLQHHDSKASVRQHSDFRVSFFYLTTCDLIPTSVKTNVLKACFGHTETYWCPVSWDDGWGPSVWELIT